MGSLIDRHAAIEVASKECFELRGVFGRIKDSLNELQAIDADPVRHGRWIEVDVGDCCYRCSECGFIRDAYLLDVGNYCPKCGAKMDGERGEKMEKENKFVGPVISGKKKRLIRKWDVIEKMSSFLGRIDQIHPPLTEWTDDQKYAILWVITQLVNMIKIMDEETVDSIPVDWIENRTKQLSDIADGFDKASLSYFLSNVKLDTLKDMLKDWEKENETDRCR